MQDTNITKNAYKAVVGKFEAKRSLGRSRPRLDNIKMYLKKDIMGVCCNSYGYK